MSEHFPRDFVWGAATASYQIEGAANEDGRGESVWDRFCATPGKVRNGDTGAVACDFYHRYRDDVRLMRELGIDAFRFSIAGRASCPTGRGRVNEKGLDFYDRLVDELLGNGITPFATLFHWDTPQVLEDQGGWPSRGIVDAYCEYVETVSSRLGDRVLNWITHNEPWVVAWVGHGWGHHAPGRTSESDALAAAHHLMLSHGRAVEILRSTSPRAEVGITLNLDYAYPASDDPADAAAAAWVDGLHNRWFLDPIFRGAYPADMLEAWADLLPAIEDGDLATISAPIDFLGVNNYTSPLVAADSNGGRSQIVRRPDVDRTDMGWEVVPDGLGDLLRRLTATTPRGAVRHRERRGVRRRARARRPGQRPRAARVPRGVHRGRRPRGRRRRPAARVLHVVAARQLRVGVGLLEALRAGLHRLRDARAGAEGQLLLVPRLRRLAACGR
jgi:Beta-glucosidase/6-phospho-beta-glucosidase/beta-galactosidase